MIRTGKLNRKITFQKAFDGKDALGQDSVEYVDYKKVWATVTPIRSSDTTVSGKKYPEATHKIYIRYREDIEPDMRICYRGRFFYILGAPMDVEGRRELLEIQAEERVDKGKNLLSR